MIFMNRIHGLVGRESDLPKEIKGIPVSDLEKIENNFPGILEAVKNLDVVSGPHNKMERMAMKLFEAYQYRKGPFYNEFIRVVQSKEAARRLNDDPAYQQQIDQEILELHQRYYKTVTSRFIFPESIFFTILFPELSELDQRNKLLKSDQTLDIKKEIRKKVSNVEGVDLDNYYLEALNTSQKLRVSPRVLAGSLLSDLFKQQNIQLKEGEDIFLLPERVISDEEQRISKPLAEQVSINSKPAFIAGLSRTNNRGEIGVLGYRNGKITYSHVGSDEITLDSNALKKGAVLVGELYRDTNNPLHTARVVNSYLTESQADKLHTDIRPHYSVLEVNYNPENRVLETANLGDAIVLSIDPGTLGMEMFDRDVDLNAGPRNIDIQKHFEKEDSDIVTSIDIRDKVKQAAKEKAFAEFIAAKAKKSAYAGVSDAMDQRAEFQPAKTVRRVKQGNIVIMGSPLLFNAVLLNGALSGTMTPSQDLKKVFQREIREIFKAAKSELKGRKAGNSEIMKLVVEKLNHRVATYQSPRKLPDFNFVAFET